VRYTVVIEKMIGVLEFQLWAKVEGSLKNYRTTINIYTEKCSK